MDAIEPGSCERWSLSAHLPRPVWIVVTTTVLFAGAIALGIGVPAWRQYVAIRRKPASQEDCPPLDRSLR